MSYQKPENVFARFQNVNPDSPEFAAVARQVWEAFARAGMLNGAFARPQGRRGIKQKPCRYPFPVATVEWADGTAFDVAFYSVVNKPLDWEHAIRVATEHYKVRKWCEHRRAMLDRPDFTTEPARPRGFEPDDFYRRNTEACLERDGELLGPFTPIRHRRWTYDDAVAVERAYKAALNVPPITYMLEHESGEEYAPN